uniref:Uncharacterized protein n=1 Tax=Panagrolaimus sp. PS1159 TaxID=55785 RepID=A0AC35FTN8_9BILA
MNNTDLLQQQQQYCDAYERLITTVGTITEELKVAKTQEFHEHSSEILQKTTNCKFPSLFLSNEENGIGKDVKVFLFFNRIFIYIPLILPQNGWRRTSIIAYFINNAKKKVIRCHSRLFPFSATISLNEKLNSEDLGIWIPFPLSPRRNPTKLIIEQSYVFQRPRFTGEPEIRTLTQEIDIKKLTARQYKQSIIKDCFQSDFELFFTFILLSWPQANIDRNSQNVGALQIELEGSQYYLKFHFEGWSMYYINSIDLKSFIYYPNLESNYWTIYQGKYQMPKRIYFFANTRANLEILLKRIKWFQGRKVQIQSVF